jgi:hypothetical protein
MKRFLPLLAALLLLLRPYCDAWAAGTVYANADYVAQSSACDSTHGVNSHDGDPCCASVDKDVVAKVVESGAVRSGTSATAAISVPAWMPGRYDGAAIFSSRKPPGAPLVPSYYARSARIQR